MKKSIYIISAIIIFISCTITASASDFSVNPFYAIKSIDEYLKVKDTIGGTNAIYYGWSRIVRDSSGQMIFTCDRNNISTYDIHTEYAIPEKLDGRLTTEMRKQEYPEAKNILMVFLDKIKYDDGRINIIDFLNMDKTAWDEFIINPMIDVLEKYDFDGVAFDIEGIMDNFTSTYYTNLQNSSLKEKYDMFLSEAKDKLKNKQMIVCVNMPEFNGYDYPYIYKTADQIILLAYPYDHFSTYTEADKVPSLAGKIKNIDVPEAQPYSLLKGDVDAIISEINQEYGASFNPKKILLGMTLQINGWIEKEITYQSKTYKYYEKTSSLDSGNKFNVSSLEDIENIYSPKEYVSESPIYKYQSKTYKKVLEADLPPDMKKIEYYYDTPETIFDKYYTIVSDYNLAGVTAWRLGIGSQKFWKALSSIFYLYDNYEELSVKTDVPKNKVWTVKFNYPIDESTINLSKESIAVLDLEGNLVPVMYKYDSTSNSVKILPVNDYKAGELYFLIIGQNIKATNGKSLIKPVTMKFKIQN